jgi:hypothetical protein
MAPSPPRKIVFVSSQAYNGNLGGLAGADSKCQALANAAGLKGVFQAWLSDSSTTAASRLAHSGIPYALVNRRIVANDWAGLTSGALLQSIDITELGATRTQTAGGAFYTWTATDTNGTRSTIGSAPADIACCRDWTDPNDEPLDGGGGGLTVVSGGIGDPARADSYWSNAAWLGCNSPGFLYCLEQ